MVGGYVDAYGDKNTQFFAPQEAQEFRELITGDFEGIGAYIETNELGIQVERLIAGSPAKEAGILAGDVFLTAN